MLDLYKNIKERRKALGMTQTELAEKTGYTNKSSIASIEAGKVDLPQSKILEFAKALDCTPAHLMGWEDPEPKTFDVSVVAQAIKKSAEQALGLDMTEEERELLTAFRELKGDTKKQFKIMAAYYKEMNKKEK